MRLPRTKAEWQEAVDGAEGALALDDCRMYGLVTGGPVVNRDRCTSILAMGAKKGFRPREGAVEMFIAACDEAEANAERLTET